MLHFFRNLKTFSSLRLSRCSGSKGFSLIEMLVSIGILSVLFGIVFLNQNTYSESMALQNLADDIGLEIVVAQSYSTSVREIIPGSGDFDTSYGVSFSLRSGADGSPTSYVVFADFDGDGRYDGDWASCSGECLRIVDITRGNFIENLCIERNNSTELCSTGTQRVDIVFARPNLQPQTIFLNSAGNQISHPSYSGSIIKLSSPNGFLKSIVASFSGNVLVRDSL